MTEYNLIFGVVLLINVLVTFRASSYWKKYVVSAGDGGSGGGDGKDEEDDSSDVEKGGGESNKNEEEKQGGGGGANKASDAAADIRHSQLLRKYLVVYLLAALSDWLQGPYVYALYDAYGYSQHEIAVLFVAGFGSSMVFGSFVGGMADQGGRRKFAILFAIIYALSCMTKREYLCFWMA
ncbi:hypothetical protein ACHAXR_009932 [Thalassiosira sp. AJA248-18]